jgi:hypothetical protein
MTDDEEKQAPFLEAAQKLNDGMVDTQKFLEAAQKARDDEIVEKYRHFQALAFRILVGEITSQEKPSALMSGEVRHMAQMLLLLDIARGEPFRRFRSRYTGYDSNEDSKK